MPGELTADVVGVVLAGGAGRRLGHDKALLELAGERLAERAAAALGRVVRDVVVAAPAESEAARLLPLPLAADRYPGAGPLAGLEAGLAWAAGRPVFALACDLPLVGEALIRHLLAAGRPGAGAAAWVVADAAGGRPQPLCGLYSAACRGEAERCLEAGRLAVHAFLDRLDTTIVRLDAALPFYHPELLLNLNRPADVERARRALAAAR